MHGTPDPDTLRLTLDDVTLDPLRSEDAPALAAAAGERRDRYQFTPVPDGEDATRAFVAKSLRLRASGLNLPFTVRWRGRVVGTTSFRDLERWDWPEGSPLRRAGGADALEIGATWLAHSAQGTVVNPTAKFLLLSHAFDAWGVHRVRLRTDRRNLRSQAAIAALGARQDGVLRGDKAGSDGTVRDSVFFSILAGEWPELAPRLRARIAARLPGNR